MHGPLRHALVAESYRPDIDGLRAVAVLSVLAFHAFPEWLTGGYVGVDVFFVISGYLISTIIMQKLERGSFSLLDFYDRRVRRIFPALIVVLVASLGFGWFALLAGEYQQLGEHVAGGAGFVANLILWNESGYFDNAADTKPLLHLWSLGIEEQYYLLWPLILWATWRAKLQQLVVIALLAAVSFWLNIHIVQNNPVSAFYLPHTRAWELLTGSALACLHLRGSFKLQPGIAALFSTAGVALIGYAAAHLVRTHQFPGWWALVPVVGAMLIIAAGSASILNRNILASRPMVAIGLISYPLYLWHWPLLSFARILTGETPSPTVRAFALVLAFVLAWATYHLIEKPIRFGQAKRHMTAGLLLAMTTLGIAGFVCFKSEGFPSRSYAAPTILKSGETGAAPFFQYLKARYTPCPDTILLRTHEYEGVLRCFQSKPGEPDFALVGDSHAEQLFLGLAEALPDRNIIFLIRNGSPLLLNPTFDDIFAYLEKSQSIRTIILTSLWTGRILQTPPGKNYIDALAATLADIKRPRRDVYLTDDIPNFQFDPELCKIARRVSLAQNRCVSPRDETERLRLLGFVTEAAQRENIPVLKTWDYFCSPSECRMALGDDLLYRDRNHLNILGSKLIAQWMLRDYPQLR